ncbi:MAG: hypothetical protein MUO40_13220 [Anaerolineaceae bacterium]|nr:hypothetical protein [Anaerolineaceae bacterium]
MKKVKLIIQFFVLILFISACSPESKHPTIIHHSAPDLKVDSAWIEQVDCPLEERSPQYYSGTCSPDSELYKMGCEQIGVSHLFVGLSYPLVLCNNFKYDSPGPEFAEVGCYLGNHHEAFLILRNGSYQLLGIGDLKKIFTPINSPNEALSYVLASTEYYPKYNIRIMSEHHYFVDEVEETYVKETKDGFLVHLFYDPKPCGCDEHYTDIVDVLVKHDGTIRVKRSYHFSKAFMCVD